MPSKTIVITGASDGIGAAAARILVRLGHDVVVVGRSEAKTKGLADQLGAPSFVADFADLGQVRGLAADLVARFPRIDVLANNAGALMGGDRQTTVDGHEKTFQVNYLAPERAPTRSCGSRRPDPAPTGPRGATTPSARR